MGTVGPGAVHLLNGSTTLRSRSPVLAICGQVPREEMGSDFFQEVDNDAVFSDVAVFNQTIASADQMPALLEQAVNAALAERSVAVLSVPATSEASSFPVGHGCRASSSRGPSRCRRRRSCAGSRA